MQDRDDTSRPSIPTSLLVQKGRTAATKGLLHDFSNVMVGLCSLSENAIEEIDPSSPLHDDMEIIRDSALRAHQLIRRISALNSHNDGLISLIDLPTWLENEEMTINATLPKGSETRFPDSGKTVLVNVNETLVRDFILLITARIAECWPEDRVRMDITLDDSTERTSMHLRFQNFSPNAISPTEMEKNDICSSAITELAEDMSAQCSCEVFDNAKVEVSLILGRR